MTREEYGRAYEAGLERTTRFLLSRGFCRDFAEDTAQAAWVRGWEMISQLRDHSFLVTWVNMIALNLSRRDIKKVLRHESLKDNASVLTHTQADSTLKYDTFLVLRGSPKADRALLEAHYLYEKSLAEIAVAEGGTELAIRARIHRAVKRLRKIQNTNGI